MRKIFAIFVVVALTFNMLCTLYIAFFQNKDIVVVFQAQVHKKLDIRQYRQYMDKLAMEYSEKKRARDAQLKYLKTSRRIAGEHDRQRFHF